MRISNIAIHHSGAIGSNPLSSSAALTFDAINHAHKDRFDMRSNLGYYVGYNVVYDPKTKAFTQAREIGEETAAQRGFNFDTFSLCIIGNYNKKPDGSSVDTLTQATKDDVVNFLIRLCRGEYKELGLKASADAILDFHASRMWPHRHFGQTDCYGTSLDDNFFRSQVETRIFPSINDLVRQLDFLRDILLKMKAYYRLGRSSGDTVGCEGFINQ